MESDPNKLNRIIGPIFGVLLCIIWIAFLISIERVIFPHQSFVHKPLIAWLNMGLIPFFVNAGNYLLYSRKLGNIETVRSMIFLKSCLLGFLIWLSVIGILYFMRCDVPYLINGFGGFLTIIVVYVLWNKVAT